MHRSSQAVVQRGFVDNRQILFSPVIEPVNRRAMLLRYCFLLMPFGLRLVLTRLGKTPSNCQETGGGYCSELTSCRFNFDYGYQSLNNIGQAVAGQSARY